MELSNVTTFDNIHRLIKQIRSWSVFPKEVLVPNFENRKLTFSIQEGDGCEVITHQAIENETAVDIE